MAYLSVHQASDGCSQPYLQHLESVHVLLLEQRLQAGGQEHQHCDQIALPGRGCGIANELQEKACGRREEAELVREGTHGCCLGQVLEDQMVWQILFSEMTVLIFPTLYANFQSELQQLHSRGVTFLSPPVMG